MDDFMQMLSAQQPEPAPLEHHVYHLEGVLPVMNDPRGRDFVVGDYVRCKDGFRLWRVPTPQSPGLVIKTRIGGFEDADRPTTPGYEGLVMDTMIAVSGMGSGDSSGVAFHYVDGRFLTKHEEANAIRDAAADILRDEVSQTEPRV